MIAWTSVWTLFQWWAVVGWPSGLPVAGAAVLVAGAFGIAGWAVWRDVRGEVSLPPAPGHEDRRAA